MKDIIGGLNLISYTYDGITIHGIPSMVCNEEWLQSSLVIGPVAQKIMALIYECRELDIKEVDFSESIDYSKIEMRKVHVKHA